MRHLIVLALIFTFLRAFAIAQGLPTAAPEDVGMSSECLERINPLMQKYVDEGKIAGVLTMVARRGKIVHLETFGKRDLAKNEPLAENTIFRIYSMSKPITSIAVMMLYEEGHFYLDAPVSKFIPEFKELKVYKRNTREGMELDELDQEMTIRHLLTHTAGLSYGWGDRPVDKMYEEAKIFEAGTTLKEMVQKLAKIPLVYQPGTKWEYSVAVDLIRLNHIPDEVESENKYTGFGLGFEIVLNMAKTGELASTGTYRWGGAAATTFWIDPQEELIAVLMTQLLNNPHPFHREFRVLTYSSITD